MKTVPRPVPVPCLFISSCAALTGAAPAPTIPASREVPASPTLALTLHARGVQIYVQSSQRRGPVASPAPAEPAAAAEAGQERRGDDTATHDFYVTRP